MFVLVLLSITSNRRPVSPMLSPHLPQILIQSIKHDNHQHTTTPHLPSRLINYPHKQQYQSRRQPLFAIRGTDMVWLVGLQLDGQSEKSGE